jgi:hypothetical protein
MQISWGNLKNPAMNSNGTHTDYTQKALAAYMANSFPIDKNKKEGLGE